MTEKLTLRKITDKNDRSWAQICQWQWQWWGEKTGLNWNRLVQFMEHSLLEERVPLTIAVEIEEELIGYYQLQMNNLKVRPDYYPWLANVYLDEKWRGKGFFRRMVEDVPRLMGEIGLSEIYVLTKKEGFYEQYGWEEVERANDYRADDLLRIIYRLKI